MNRVQKQSWIMVISIGIAFFISCIIVAYWASAKGFPAAWHGFLFTCLGGLGYFACLLVKKDKPAIVDERDLAIKALAKNNAFIASYISLILLSMGIFIYKRPGNPVNVNVLPMCVCITGVIAALIESLTYIIEYGKDNKLPEGGEA
ncbi:MAG: hypothetical protein ACYS8S_03835 [Planctomycetota bacterium]|jgi:dipeptide/tripeptide permease